MGYFPLDPPLDPPLDEERDQSQMRRHWLEWAAAQIDASLRMDRDAAENLLAAVTELLEPAEREPQGTSGPRDSALGRVVAAVQVHDRLMQQLTHVATALRALSDLAAATRTATQEEWGALRRRQLATCTMHEERSLLLDMVPDPRAEARPESMHLPDGDSIELFQ